MQFSHKFLKQNDTVRLIWAMGDADMKDPKTFPKHRDENRGAKSVMLLDSKSRDAVQAPPDAYAWNFTADKVDDNEF